MNTKANPIENGAYLAMHEMEHVRYALDKAITNIPNVWGADARAKLYAMRHLIALDNHIKQTIAALKESV